MKADKCNVLIIESDQNVVEVASPILITNNCKVSYLKQGLNVLTFLQKNDFSIILLADSLPDEEGFQVARRIREKEEFDSIPIIFLLSSVDNIEKAFSSGGTDYILKPLVSEEFEARLCSYIKYKLIEKKVDDLVKEKKQIMIMLDETLMEMKVLNRVDPLTRILNRRTLLEKITDEQIRSKRNQQKFSLLLIDIEDCNRFNDSFGYECGDFIIKKTAQLLDHIVRERDFTARWHGDQFMLLLPETDEDGLEILQGKISGLLNETSYNFRGLTHNVSFYFVPRICSGKEGIDEIIQDVENSLEKSKKAPL